MKKKPIKSESKLITKTISHLGTRVDIVGNNEEFLNKQVVEYKKLIETALKRNMTFDQYVLHLANERKNIN